VYVISRLHGGPTLSPHDRLWRLWSFIATLRDHGAAHVTAVVPYLAYARKDRITKPFDPLSLRHVAQCFEAVGTQRIIVLEAHNVAAFQNAFRIPTLHVDAYEAFDQLVDAQHSPWVVVSPDPGGVKRAQLWREALVARLGQPVGFAMVDKRRSAGVVSGGDLLAGKVDGANVLLFDDLIASGLTMVRAAQTLREAGSRQVIAVAAHGLFMAGACEALTDPGIAAIAVTNSVPTFRVPDTAQIARRIQVFPIGPLLARAIARCSQAGAMRLAM
jgi:ribose-phosphate pyrophosphokinase